MSEFVDGFNTMARIQDEAAQRERQKREDAYIAEQRGLARAARQQTDQIMGQVYDSTGQFQDNTDQFLNQYGLNRSAPDQSFNGVNARSAIRAAREGVALPQAQDSYQAPGLAPARANPQREQVRAMMALARAGRDAQGFSQAYSNLRALDSGSNAARIYDAVLSAAPEKVAQFAQQYSDSQHIPGKIVVNPRTGLSTLTLDGGKPIQMDRAQMAQYVAGLYKLHNGDPSGHADIASISKDLATAADKMFTRQKGVADTSNDVVLKDSQMRNDYLRTVAARDKVNKTAYDRMDEQKKLEYKALIDGERDAQKLLDSAMGALGPEDDPARIPAVIYAKQRIAAAQQAQLQFSVANGLVTPESMAIDIVGKATSPEEVTLALTRLAKMTGTGFSDAVAAAVQGTDKYKAFGRKQPTVLGKDQTTPTGLTPPRRGVFIDPKGQIQLLQPFYDASDAIGGLRKRLQDQSRDQ